MVEPRGQLLPVYVVLDESDSMSPNIDELNQGLRSLHSALLLEPMAAAKVRMTILGFSDTVIVRLRRADLRAVDHLEPVRTRTDTRYGGVFADLLTRIPSDVALLRQEGYAVHRPAVFFLSDGQPTDEPSWRAAHAKLVDRRRIAAAPNIIACGIGKARPSTILAVATSSQFAFVTIPGAAIGAAVAKFCAALVRSLVQSVTSLQTAHPELYVERPEGFHLAIDIL
jgi:uncharacterized protein YegL